MLDKEKIINFNSKLGIKTEFFYGDEEILGYAEGDTIYLNLNSNQDFEKTNRHEILHFFEDTEEFQIIKKQLLNIQNLDKLRNDYKFKYFGLYTEEDINKGILDTEIVIDMLGNNSTFIEDDLVKVGDIILTNKIKELESRRYLNLSVNHNLFNTKGLSTWEKLFALNYYNSKDYLGKNRVMRSGDKVKIIKEDINIELNRLYSLVNKPKAFQINVNSPELIRKYKGEIIALELNGEKDEANRLIKYRKLRLKELSNIISNELYEEYVHLVNFIKETTYEESFKALMLRETLLKTYMKEKIHNEDVILVDKRNMHESIMGHMTFNKIVLDTIYYHAKDYNNFANLYYAGLNLFNQSISKRSKISLEHVNTYGMGHWIKFDGKKSNEKEYIENAKELAVLVQDTPWCTKNSAPTHLAGGDFYVFVDNDNKPHIAVRLKGEKIDEVRGIKNGNAQELEDEYRDVAISFLENNKKIKNGIEWLEKEEWNKRLIYYNKEIKNHVFTLDEVDNLLNDVFKFKDYKSHLGYINSNLIILKKNLILIKDILAKYYNCSEEEICIGNANFSGTYFTKCPYKVIFGDVNFENSRITDLGKLEFVSGNANFKDSVIKSLGNLKYIGGNTDFRYSVLLDLGELLVVGGNADFRYSKVKDLNKLQLISRSSNFEDSNVISLGNLQRVGRDIRFDNSNIENIGKLEYVGGTIYYDNSKLAELGTIEKDKDGRIFFSFKHNKKLILE